MTNSSHTKKTNTGWGGKRTGAGRKPGPNVGKSKVTTVVLTDTLIRQLHDLGGSRWIREQIENGYSRLKKDENLLGTLPEVKTSEVCAFKAAYNDGILFEVTENYPFCPQLEAGDLLIVSPKEFPVSGQIVVAANGDKCSLAKLIKQEGKSYLVFRISDDDVLQKELTENQEILGTVLYQIKKQKDPNKVI